LFTPYNKPENSLFIVGKGGQFHGNNERLHMKFLNVTELRLRATQIVSEIERTGEEIIVTKKGKPVVLMSLVEAKDFQLKKNIEGGKKHGKDKRYL